ncbi:hypothetical protein WTH01_11910 [Weissella thailandensis]|nr:hypothetical protein WTH01_11910 [Weissella thailandensis]
MGPIFSWPIKSTNPTTPMTPKINEKFIYCIVIQYRRASCTVGCIYCEKNNVLSRMY